jgi:hypothetical protein
LYQAGKHTSGELAELIGVARSTIERMNQPTVDQPGLGLTSAHPRNRLSPKRLNEGIWRRSLRAGEGALHRSSEGRDANFFQTDP